MVVSRSVSYTYTGIDVRKGIEKLEYFIFEINNITKQNLTIR